VLRGVRGEDVHAGVTAARLSALSVLVFVGPVTVGRLADAEQVSVPTISRMIAQRVDEGLVRREPDATDRRLVWLHATEQGTRILWEARRRRIEALVHRIEGLREGELRQLARAADIVERVFRG
jgi:DNA-binding MarR family transcriptional regulator